MGSAASRCYSRDGDAEGELDLRRANVKSLPGPISELKSLLGERLQTAHDEFYSAARGDPQFGSDVAWDGKFRQTWNLDDVGFPSAIATVNSVAEVQAVVKYAAKHCIPAGTLLCIACGRHSHQCMLNDSFVLDLQRLDTVTIDVDARVATVGGGAQQGQLDMACEPHGLATTAGHNASTGCGGLILQGGHGFLERKFGLVVDNLLEAEVVLADGSLVRANSKENADLFWALKGGGGNFGVVVSFTLKLHPLAEIYAGSRVHIPLGLGPLVSREELIMHFFEKTVGGPDEATGLLVLPGRGPVIEMLLWVGDANEGQKYFEGRTTGWPVKNDLGMKKYHSEVQRFYPPGNADAVYQTGVLLENMTEEAAKTIASLASSEHAPTSNCALIILPLGGKVSTVASDETAFAHRGMRAWLLVMGNFPPGDTAAREQAVGWVRKVKAAILPYSKGAQYGVLSEVQTHQDESNDTLKMSHETDGGAVGCMMNTAEIAGTRNIYGSNLRRLQELKAKFDPTNVFRINDNILPLKA